MAEKVAIAVVGAGLVGRRHVAAILASDRCTLAAIVDPTDVAQEFANETGALWFAQVGDMFDCQQPDGVILATPNDSHEAGALTCINAGCPVLVEKPLAHDLASGERIVAAAKAAGVAVLTGHHRRHTALIKQAKALIDRGELGAVVSVQGTFWLYKPDDYFDTEWRTGSGGGPILINLIHDIDTMRHLLGDIVQVHGFGSNAVRGHGVEDTAAILLRFASGALGTMAVSDTIVAPWSWELTAAENPSYPATGQSCYLIGGTEASLSFPDMTVWRYGEEKSWTNPIDRAQHSAAGRDALSAQIEQFVAVITGQAAPLVSGQDGLATLRVVEAIRRSISSGATVDLPV